MNLKRKGKTEDTRYAKKNKSGETVRNVQSDQEPVTGKDRRRPKLIGVLILIVLLAGGALFTTIAIIDAITWVSTDDSRIDGNHVNLGAKILGRISRVWVSEGDPVEPGQELVLLDEADLRSQETQAAAQRELAKQNLVLSSVNRDRALDDYNRTRGLYNSGAVTREQFEHATKAKETADAQYAIAQAQVSAANAQLGVIETQLLNTRLTAPIGGIIAKQSFYPGDVIQPSQTILTINDLDHLWVTANFEETKISRIKKGADAEIYVDAYAGQQFAGKVIHIGSGIIPPAFSIGEFTKTTQRVPVKIALDSVPEGVTLIPGLSVEVKIRAQ